MAYEWDSSLECGHEQIDNQHKQLVAALNALHDAHCGGKGHEEVERTLDFLVGYTIKHFADEERLQEQSNYPDFYRHKQEHDNFKGVARGLGKRLAAEGATDDFVSSVYATVGTWLVNHIKGDDFRFAAYLRAQA